jgi:drug/metabolite transporter (DMT)-like permease
VIYPKIKILHLFYIKSIHHFCAVMKKDLRKAYIALAVVSFFWGTTYLAAKISAQHMPGLFVAGVRQAIAGAILLDISRASATAGPIKSRGPPSPCRRYCCCASARDC